MNRTELFHFSKTYYQYDWSTPTKAAITALKIASLVTGIIPLIVKFLEIWRHNEELAEKTKSDNAAKTIQKAFRTRRANQAFAKFHTAVQTQIKKEKLASQISATLKANPCRKSFKDEHQKKVKIKETISSLASALVAAKKGREDYKFNNLIYGPRIRAEKEKKIEAATKIQTAFRSYQGRKQFKQLKAHSHSIIKKDETLVEDGYGQFIVSKNGKSLTQEEYAKVYSILQKYAFHAPENKSRYDAIKEELNAIDPEYTLTFIPRTLYDLFFMRVVIHEEIKDKRACPFQTAHFDRVVKYGDIDEQELNAARANCWHIAASMDRALSSDHEFVKILACRLNNYISDRIKTAGKISKHKVICLTEVEAAYLTRVGVKYNSILNNRYEGECGMTGLSVNFGLDISIGARVVSNSIKISTCRQASLIFKAVELELSEAAKRSVILYGSKYTKNETIDSSKESRFFGTGLYGGAIFDYQSIAYEHKEFKTVFAIPVPFDDAINNPVLDIPKDHPISQLSGRGPFLQARSKLAEVPDGTKPEMGLFRIRDIPERVKSVLSKDETNARLKAYTDKAVILSN